MTELISSNAKTDERKVFPKISSAIKKVLRHPKLAIHFYESEAELSRRHVVIELKKAQLLYDVTVSRQAYYDIVRMYKREIKCYGNSYLYALSRNFKPCVVVETGVHYGSSSAFLLQALHDNSHGHLYSIDLPDTKYIRDDGTQHHDSFRPERVGFAVPMGLRDRWTLIIGDVKEKLPQVLGNVGSVDMFFHDSMHTYEHMYFEYETIFSKLKIGGLLVSDDVLWNSAFLDFCKDKNVEPNVVEGVGFTFKR